MQLKRIEDEELSRIMRETAPSFPYPLFQPVLAPHPTVAPSASGTAGPSASASASASASSSAVSQAHVSVSAAVDTGTLSSGLLLPTVGQLGEEDDDIALMRAIEMSMQR